MLPINTILHPTDFSESSRAAFAFAGSLAHDYSARLVILHAYPAPTALEWPDLSHEDDYEDALMPRLQDLKPADSNVRVEYRLVEGRAVDAILDAADHEHCDLIVMGTHGRSGFSRTLAGSVAEAVSRRARCPVATVRPSSHVPEPPASGNGHPSANGDPAREVAIPVGRFSLPGTLQWIGKPQGVVVFAHGSGSSRFSPRNRLVASTLNDAGFATLLFDLLSESEGADRGKVFNVELLANRLAAAAKWVSCQPETAGVPVGLFGASTGSAAALIAAATHPNLIAAVVSRGGRPDLAWDHLPAVHAPTMLIVGAEDEPVVSWNRESFDRLPYARRLEIIPSATHLFEEPGALERVAALAREWFEQYLPIAPKLECQAATSV